MSQERKGRSVALSGVIGFVLLALLIGMAIGGALTFFVVGPMVYGHQQDSSNQANNQNSNYQNGYNNQGPTGNPNNNNQYGNNNQQNSGNQSQGMTNSNPPITNPTGTYSTSGAVFNLNLQSNGQQASGQITADISCAVQQNGNSIQLDVTVTPTNVPQSLNGIITNNNPVTFNFAGTTSGSQFSAQASGGGSDSSSPSFNLNANGSISSSSLTISISSAADSQIGISMAQPITLQPN